MYGGNSRSTAALLLGVLILSCGALAQDQVVLSSGIRIRGAVLDVTEASVTIKVQKNEMIWPLAKVHSITRAGETKTYNALAERPRRAAPAPRRPVSAGEPQKAPQPKRTGPPPAAMPASAFKRPSSEEALRYLKSMPRVWRSARGKKILVQLWKDYTLHDLKTVKLIHPGGHIEDPSSPNLFSRKHLHIRPGDWKYFTAFEGLEQFEMGHDMEGVTDECILYLGQLPQSMHTIKLEMSEATGSGVRHLQNLKRLRYLSLNFSRTINDTALVHAGGIPSLEHLDVCGCPSITGTGVQSLAGLKKLRVLKIGSCSLSDASLRHFVPLTVEELDLSHVEEGWIVTYRGGGHCRFTVSVGGLYSLLSLKGSLPNLKRLILRKTKFTKQQKDQLARLRPGLVVR